MRAFAIICLEKKIYTREVSKKNSFRFDVKYKCKLRTARIRDRKSSNFTRKKLRFANIAENGLCHFVWKMTNFDKETFLIAKMIAFKLTRHFLQDNAK